MPVRTAPLKSTLPNHLSSEMESAPLAPDTLQRLPHKANLGAVASGAVRRAPCFQGRAVDIQPLSELARWKDAYHNMKPVIIDIDPTIKAAYETLFWRLSPEGLQASPMVDAPLQITRGVDPQGARLDQKITTLREFLAPLHAAKSEHRAVAGSAYAPLPINENPCLSFDKNPLDDARPWWDYVATTAPPWPRDLLFYDDREPPPSYDTAVLLGVGKGEGAPYHFHGSNLFIQVHGRKKWSVYSPEEFEPYLKPDAAKKLAGKAETAPLWATAMDQEFFDSVAWPNVQPPYEFVTEPGQMVYLPCGWMHRVSNLDDYTVSYVRVVNDVPPADLMIPTLTLLHDLPG